MIESELGMLWDDVSLGPGSVAATFIASDDAAERLRVCRVHLLGEFIDVTVDERAARIARQRATVERVHTFTAFVRIWSGQVREHLAASRARA
jgi:hypothetical protein